MQDYDQLAHTSTHFDYGSSSAATSNAKSNGKVSLDDFIYELKQRNEEMCDNNHYPHLNGSAHYPNGDLEVPSSSSAYLNGALDSSQTNGHHSGQNGHQNGSHYPTYDTQHLLGQLAQKEKDLVLAAELGKALLDRNEELTRTNEQINEEYTRNLEVGTFCFCVNRLFFPVRLCQCIFGDNETFGLDCAQSALSLAHWTHRGRKHTHTHTSR